jgi:hypothetical protein
MINEAAKRISATITPIFASLRRATDGPFVGMSLSATRLRQSNVCRSGRSSGSNPRSEPDSWSYRPAGGFNLAAAAVGQRKRVEKRSTFDLPPPIAGHPSSPNRFGGHGAMRLYPPYSLVGSHNIPRSFHVAGGTSINNFIKRRGQHCRGNRFDLHRRVTTPADYGHLQKVMRFLTFTLKRHWSLRAFLHWLHGVPVKRGSLVKIDQFTAAQGIFVAELEQKAFQDVLCLI